MTVKCVRRQWTYSAPYSKEYTWNAFLKLKIKNTAFPRHVCSPQSLRNPSANSTVLVSGRLFLPCFGTSVNASSVTGPRTQRTRQTGVEHRTITGALPKPPSPRDAFSPSFPPPLSEVNVCGFPGQARVPKRSLWSVQYENQEAFLLLGKCRLIFSIAFFCCYWMT